MEEQRVKRYRILELFNQLDFFHEYTRHEEMTIFRVTTSPVGERIEKQNSCFITI